MKTLWIICLSIVAFLGAAPAQELKPIVRLDSALDAIVPPDAKLEKVADHFIFLEGPAWVRNGGYLIFSDTPGNAIDKYDPRDGKVSVFLERAGFTGIDPTGVGSTQESAGKVFNQIGPSGITLDPQGRVTFCAIGDRQVVRLERGGRRTVLASRYEGKRFSGPNDLVYKSDGSLYFTDSATALPGRDKDPSREIAFFGVYLWERGKLQALLTDPALRPNGIAIDPTEKYLYVNDNATKTIKRYVIQRDDTIDVGSEKIFVALSGVIRGPGGTRVDIKGNVYNTATDSVWVNSPEGKHLGPIPFPQEISNLAFGDADGKTLYVTGRSELYRIRLEIPGVRP